MATPPTFSRQCRELGLVRNFEAANSVGRLNHGDGGEAFDQVGVGHRVE